MKNYKGALLDTGISFVFGILFIGILLGAGAIAIVSMPTSVGTTAQNNTATINAYAGTASMNLGAQMPTVGTIAGVGLIILVLFVAIGGYVFGMKKD